MLTIGTIFIIAELYYFSPAVRAIFVDVAEQLGADEFLAGRLTDSDLKVRGDAGEALVRRGAKAVPVLIVKLSDPDPWKRRSAASTLAKIGSAAEGATAALQQMAIEDDDEGVLETSGQALGIVARGHPKVVEELLKMMDSSTDSRRLAATRAAARLDEPRAVPLLISSLKHANPKIREEAAESLGEMKGMAIAAIPTLLETLGDPVPAVQSEVSQALAKILAKAERNAIEPELMAKAKLAIEKNPGIKKAAEPDDDDP